MYSASLTWSIGRSICRHTHSISEFGKRSGLKKRQGRLCGDYAEIAWLKQEAYFISLLLLRNLPLSRWQRLGQYALTYGLLWLPESLILLRNYPADVSLRYAAWLWLTGWGWLVLLHALAYSRTSSTNRWQAGVFAGFIVGLLAIMSGLPVEGWFLIGWLGTVALSFF